MQENIIITTFAVLVLVPSMAVLKAYEIHRNNQQTTDQSILSTMTESNFSYLQIYIDFFPRIYALYTRGRRLAPYAVDENKNAMFYTLYSAL